ncbi:LOW QUALITY PROTEIN: uncharacterized protein LOC112599226 [Melanaphis sacchari]|uniref:LOW QUALITY PROTEIN: uncharacterized protein LOC112599226 n=1 Tax=Melanaphis sacchari TaxID=742174 RepID=UPI000DC153B8|nr:LOW QUALITY PROTEIN: uncharacterized protein LOC112599226 [Melanaphis sacchari]
MKQIEAIAVLSVESDRVQLTVISNRDGSEVVTSAETFPLITAEPKSRRVGCNDDPSADQSHSAAVEADDRASSCSAAEKPPTGPGHVEQDPEVVWEAVLRVMADAVDKMSRVGAPVTYIKSVAVVNEMATLVAWNAVTGKPVHNMVHWSDVRMADGGTADRRVAATAVDGREVHRGQLPVRHAGRVADVEADGRPHVPDGRDERVVHRAAGHGHAVLDRRRRSRGLTAAAWPAVRKPGKRRPPSSWWPAVRAVRARDAPAQRRAVRAGVLPPRAGGRHADRPDGGGRGRDRGPPCRQPAGGPMPVVGCERTWPTEASENRLRADGGVQGQRGRVAEEHGPGQSWDDCVTAYAASGAPVDPGTYAVPAFGGLPSAPYVRPDARPVVCGFGDRTGRAHLIAAAVDSICHSTVDIVRCVVAGSTSKIAEPCIKGKYASHRVEEKRGMS